MKNINFKQLILKSIKFLTVFVFGLSVVQIAQGGYWKRDHYNYKDAFDNLNISEAQEARLKDIFEKYHNNNENKGILRNIGHANMQKLLSAEYKTADDINKILADTYTEFLAQMPDMINSLEEAHKVLTTEQRIKLAAELKKIIANRKDSYKETNNRRSEKFNKRMASRWDLNDAQKILLNNISNEFMQIRISGVFENALQNSIDELAKDSIDHQNILNNWNNLANELQVKDDNLAAALAEFKASLSEKQIQEISERFGDERRDSRRSNRWW